jgi:hypothetical protein
VFVNVLLLLKANNTTMPTLEINDIAMMLQLIDVVTTRGAFRGEELLITGTLRNKLAEIVKANQPVPEAPKTE